MYSINVNMYIFIFWPPFLYTVRSPKWKLTEWQTPTSIVTCGGFGKKLPPSTLGKNGQFSCIKNQFYDFQSDKNSFTRRPWNFKFWQILMILKWYISGLLCHSEEPRAIAGSWHLSSWKCLTSEYKQPTRHFSHALSDIDLTKAGLVFPPPGLLAMKCWRLICEIMELHFLASLSCIWFYAKKAK